MIDTSFPGWLAARNAQRDYSAPWLVQAVQAGAQMANDRAKLPLQLQQMSLQNDAAQLQIEHQGLMNDLVARTIQDEKDDLPRYMDAMEPYRNNPIGLMDAPIPAFKSQKYQNLWSDARIDAGRSFAVQGEKYRLAEDYKIVGEAQLLGFKADPPTNGRYDPNTVSDAGAFIEEHKTKELEAKQKNELEKIQERNSWRFDPITGEPIAGGGSADKELRYASDVADLKAQLRASEIATRKMLPGSDEAIAAFEKHQQLKDKLDALEQKAGGRTKADVELVTYGGKQFLKNTVTGALHEVSKTVDRQQFIAAHLTSYLRDMPGGDADKAARELGDIYDKHLAPAATAGTNQPPSGNAGFRYDPATRKLVPR